MRLLFVLLFGGIVGMGIALWYQGEPPFVASPAPGTADVTLTISDAFLSKQASPTVAADSHGLVPGIQVTSSKGDIAYVNAKAQFAGVSVPIGLSVTPEAANGSVAFTVKSAHVGPLPLPAGVVTGPITDIINSQIAAMTNGTAFEVTGVRTTVNGIQVFLRHR
jgi:hypothetical protein